jgi:arylsulfate sulfotransferase
MLSSFVPRLWKASSSLSLSLAMVGLALAQAVGAAPAFTAAPTIVQNPNPRAPLAAVLHLATSEPVEVTVKLKDGQRSWSVQFPSASNLQRSLPIVGLRPAVEHQAKVSIRSKSGKVVSFPQSLKYRPPALPASLFDFPQLKVHRADVSRMEPGITLLTVRRRALGRSEFQTTRQREFALGWSLIVGVNELAEVVWYYQSDSRISGIATLANGNIFFHTARFSPVEIDLLGNEIRRWGAAKGPRAMPPGSIPVDAVTLHHQPEELPNGNFLSMEAIPKMIDNYYTSEHDAAAPRKTQKVMGDRIIEFTPSGEVVWRWDSFDYLDPFKIGYDTFWSYWEVRGFPGAVDWTHGNGVHYDERDDSIIASFRNLSAVVKIDRKTKQIKWILARDIGWSPQLRAKLLRPLGDNFQYPSHQHNPRVTPDGNIVVFNNNVHQAIPFTGEVPKPADQSFSNAIVYAIDDVAMTARVTFATPTVSDVSCNSFAMGDAHVLPKTRNVLVNFSLCYPGMKIETWNQRDRTKTYPDDLPSYPRLREFRKDDPLRPVFDLELVPAHDLFQWEVFGVYRVPGLYPSELRKAPTGKTQ